METIPFPNKKYQIIYADPPWSYKDKARAGKRGASFKYPTQDKEWLKKLPVESIADDNCVLFLWVTMPLLGDGLELMKAWGFEYKTCGFTWVKRNKVSPTWFFGMGNWTRSNAELCLIGKRGNIKRVDASISSVIDTPIQEHSKKPDCVREKIVKLIGDKPRIELFARQRTEGWDVWGNEV
ncbi:MAG: MT-A70 family methyltransferase [Methanofastidiosum sp.]